MLLQPSFNKFANMVDKMQHKKIKRLHRYFAIFAILCVLLSACAVKMSIKSFIGVSGPKTEQTKSVSKAFIGSVVNSCTFDSKFEQTIVGAKTILSIAAQLLPFILSSFLAFVFGLFLVKEANRYGLGERVGNLAPLPIFLQNRTLRI